MLTLADIGECPPVPATVLGASRAFSCFFPSASSEAGILLMLLLQRRSLHAKPHASAHAASERQNWGLSDSKAHVFLNFFFFLKCFLRKCCAVKDVQCRLFSPKDVVSSKTTTL